MKQNWMYLEDRLCKLTINDFAEHLHSTISFKVAQLNIQMSQGSAATNLRWGGRLYFSFFCSSSENSAVKELLQEAQLLLGYRATRKHAKDCWNGRGNDNLGWNYLQTYFKVLKNGTNLKLVYDFLLVADSNFCRITHRFWEIWYETVQWPWNMPKVIDSRITWKLACGHVCKMLGRQWTNEAKIAILNDPTLIWRPLSSEPPRISA